jgi:streptogramin lyase
VGKLDLRTEIVTEYKIPTTPGTLPGAHHVVTGRNDVAFFSEGWAHKLAKFDPRTEKITEVPIQSRSRTNSLGFGNFGLAPDDSIWISAGNEAAKIDPQTGKVVQRYPYKGRGRYESIVSADGNFWAGGAPLNPNENSGAFGHSDRRKC